MLAVPFRAIADGLNGVWQSITKVWDWLVAFPNMLWDGLKSLFIPHDGFFQNEFNELRQIFYDRIPLLGQCLDFFQAVIAGATQPSTNYPVFSFDYKGATYNIFDFSVFAQYRGFVHMVVLLFAYYFFIRRMLHRLPSIIGNLPYDGPMAGSSGGASPGSDVNPVSLDGLEWHTIHNGRLD